MRLIAVYIPYGSKQFPRDCTDVIIDLVIASIGHHGKDKGALRVKVQVGTDVSAHTLVAVNHPVIKKIIHTVDAQAIGTPLSSPPLSRSMPSRQRSWPLIQRLPTVIR